MRYLRQFCAVITLLCALAFSAYAGNIECDGITTPPPPQATATGDIPNDVAGEMQNGIQSTDIATVTMLTLLETVLSLS